MGKEIERKYLIDKKKWDVLAKPEPVFIQQNYILNKKPISLRARIIDNKGFIAIKKGKGVSRLEYEYEIPLMDAKELLHLDNQFEPIEKERYRIPYGKHIWDVDIFLGENRGLIVAEIELSCEEEAFEKPDWVIKEVTSIRKYFNTNLQTRPYKMW